LFLPASRYNVRWDKKQWGTGWKGRGLYATYGADAAWHIEGGPVEPGNLVRFQIRPDPLSR
jgi:hypothetical protein